jgi:hypothetical protein
MIAICTDGAEVEISGTVNEFRAIRTALISLLSSSGLSVSFPAAPLDASPYPLALSELIINRRSGPTLAAITKSSIVVGGSDDSLARFSSWFNFSNGAQPGHHEHFEPVPGDPYHSSESVPIIITISQAGA